MKPNSDPKIEFFKLFRFHFGAGTGRPRTTSTEYGSHWTRKYFSDAISKTGNSITDDSIGNWLKGNNLPRREQKAAILDVFFPDMKDKDKQPSLARADMEQLWEQANRSAYESRRSLGKLESTKSEDEDYDNWQLLDRQDFKGLVELRLHKPTNANEKDTFFVNASLRFSTIETEWERKPVSVGLLEAFLSIDSLSFQQSQSLSEIIDCLYRAF